MGAGQKKDQSFVVVPTADYAPDRAANRHLCPARTPRHTNRPSRPSTTRRALAPVREPTSAPNSQRFASKPMSHLARSAKPWAEGAPPELIWIRPRTPESATHAWLGLLHKQQLQARRVAPASSTPVLSGSTPNRATPVPWPTGAAARRSRIVFAIPITKLLPAVAPFPRRSSSAFGSSVTMAFFQALGGSAAESAFPACPCGSGCSPTGFLRRTNVSTARWMFAPCRPSGSPRRRKRCCGWPCACPSRHQRPEDD